MTATSHKQPIWFGEMKGLLCSVIIMAGPQHAQRKTSNSGSTKVQLQRRNSRLCDTFKNKLLVNFVTYIFPQ